MATASTTTFTNWFRVGGATGEITVPDWAHHLLARVEINGIRDPGGTASTYLMKLVVGPTEGRQIRMTAPLVGTPGQFLATWTDWLACSSDRRQQRGLDADETGRRRQPVGGRRRLATSACWLTFLGAAGWYPAL